MTAFKILPTDPRFQALNLTQKLVLLYSIDKDFASKFNIAKALMDKLTFYINPDIYKQEKDVSSEYIHQNAEFEQQSIMGRSTGKLESSQSIKDAIKRIDAMQKRESGGDVLILSGKDGEVVLDPKNKDQGELG